MLDARSAAITSLYKLDFQIAGMKAGRNSGEERAASTGEPRRIELNVDHLAGSKTRSVEWQDAFDCLHGE